MPIEVRHDQAPEGLMLLALLAGMAQNRPQFRPSEGLRIPTVPPASDTTGKIISASGPDPFQRGAPAPPTLEQQAELRARTAGMVARAELPAQIDLVKAKAAAEPAEWEARYTARDKADIARITNGVKQAKASGQWTQQELMELERVAQMRVAGIEKTLMPRDMSKPQYDPQESKVDETSGALMGFDRAGNRRVLVQPQNMPDYLNAKAVHEAGVKEADRQMKRQTAIDNYRLKLAQDDMAVQTGTDKDNKPTFRPYSTAEIDAVIRRAGVGGANAGQSQQGNTVRTIGGEQIDYSQLPIGAYYVGPDGRKRRKS